jgi:hypothetical protein
MPKPVILDALHVTISIPADTPDRTAARTLRHLRSRSTMTAIRRAIQDVIDHLPGVTKCRVNLSR